jgi:hypothetical protein
MRFCTALLFLAASLASAQNSVDPEVARVQAEVARVRALVELGAAPPLQLAKAEAAMADAQDAAILRKTLYGKDLTEDESSSMLAAANRRLERRKQEYAAQQKLVDAGAAPRNSLAAPQAAIDMAAKECGMAGSRAALVKELTDMADQEALFSNAIATQPAEAPAYAERHDGDGVFDMLMLADIQSAYQRQFGAALPVSALGETAVHRSMGFDHRGRVDVALNPDSAEGQWLRTYLTVKRIPFFVFRQAVPGKATGAHIHIGPASTRLASGG